MEYMSLSLAKFEKDFISFHKILPKLRERFADKFVAYVDGKIVSSKDSVEEIKEDLISQEIEPSEVVIEFVSKEEIRVIV